MCCLAFVSAAGVGGVAAAQTASPPQVYYDVPTATAQAEINMWASMYDTLLKTGTPAAGADTFAFTNPAMNTPLFSVLIAAKRTVGDVTGINPCNPDSTPIDPGGGVDAVSANATSWMTSNTVSTDVVNNPDGSLALIDAAIADPNAVLALDGNTLQAINLSATTVTGASAPANYAAVSDDTLMWISQFTAASMAHAATLNPSDNARRLLLGTPRTVDEMEDWARVWGVTNQKSFGTYQINATFGRYGSLPIIVLAVGFSVDPNNCYILVDGMNGAVDGPFVSGSNIDASHLLAAHSDAYEAGTATALVRADSDCKVVRADSRTTWTPPPTVLPGTVPPGWLPLPGSPPGKPTVWTCVIDSTGTCVCTATYNYQPAAGTPCPVFVPPMSSPGLCLLKLDLICTAPPGDDGGGCNASGTAPPGAPTTPPSGTAPGSPIPTPRPPVTGVPGAPGTATCVDSWWYWS